MNVTVKSFEVLFGIAGWYTFIAVWYAFIREAVAITQRVRYNKTHKYKVFLISIGDIPYFLIEFFLLPLLAVRWVTKRLTLRRKSSIPQNKHDA